jgi:hypothetical protein
MDPYFSSLPKVSLAMPELLNPFTITKASDFTDEEISTFWVDLSTSGRAILIANPYFKGSEGQELHEN